MTGITGAKLVQLVWPIQVATTPMLLVWPACTMLDLFLLVCTRLVFSQPACTLPECFSLSCPTCIIITGQYGTSLVFAGKYNCDMAIICLDLFLFLNYMMVTSIPQAWIQNIVSSLAQHWLMVTHSPSPTLQCSPTLAQPYTMMMPTPRPDCILWWHIYPGLTIHYGDAHTQAGLYNMVTPLPWPDHTLWWCPHPGWTIHYGDTPTLAQPYTMVMPTPRSDYSLWWHPHPGRTVYYG